MTDDGARVIGVLAKLADEDPDAAGEALRAFDWMTGEHDLTVMTQDRLQRFLWYELPLRWTGAPGEKVKVADSLARALDLLGRPRYAAICRSETTTAVFDAYDRSDDDGRSAFLRARAASGIEPPDVGDFQWGATMGFEEASALSSTSEMLEEAVATGRLVPGGRRWKAGQQELTRAHLERHRVELAGQSLAQLILTERIDTWLNIRRSEIRRRTLAGIANRLLHPVQLAPEDLRDPLPSLSWLLAELDGGITLTQTGNLNRSFVQAAAPRFGWDLSTPPRNEDDLFGLGLLRRFAQRLGLARRAGRRLVLTAKGGRLAAQPEQLWRVVALDLLRGKDFETFAGELLGALLVGVDSMSYDEVADLVAAAAAEEGYRDSRSGEVPDRRAAGWAVGGTAGLLGVLGLLSTGGGWSDRSYGLTEVGKATVLQSLRARATGPRTFLGG